VPDRSSRCIPYPLSRILGSTPVHKTGHGMVLGVLGIMYFLYHILGSITVYKTKHGMVLGVYCTFCTAYWGPSLFTRQDMEFV
jgi:hypothetical protein